MHVLQVAIKIRVLAEPLLALQTGERFFIRVHSQVFVEMEQISKYFVAVSLT
jgi:hypothetical protein